jgi:hypothetical protein
MDDLGLNITASGFKTVTMLLRFLAAIPSFSAFHNKPSRRFYEFLESPRMIDN